MTLPIIADVNSLILTEIEIEGEKHRFLIDTGGGANFIAPDFAAKFQGKVLKRLPSKDQTVATATQKAVSKAYERTWKIGALEYSSMLAFEQDTHRFNTKQDGVDCCSGILGLEFLKRHPVLVDRNLKRITLGASKESAPGEWARVSLEFPNERAVVLQCRSSLGPKVAFRLDSGSEAPLILQTRFISSHSLMSRIEAAGMLVKPGHLALISFGELSCGDGISGVRTDALVYAGSTGALAHDFIDGNLGGAILGQRYLIDLAKKALYIDKSVAPKDIRVKSMGEGLKVPLR